jgi:hypothetical protein
VESLGTAQTHQKTNQAIPTVSFIHYHSRNVGVCVRGNRRKWPSTFYTHALGQNTNDQRSNGIGNSRINCDEQKCSCALAYLQGDHEGPAAAELRNCALFSAQVRDELSCFTFGPAGARCCRHSHCSYVTTKVIVDPRLSCIKTDATLFQT